MCLVLETLQNVEMVSLHQEGEEWLVKHGVATFPSFEIAARILKYLKQYNDFLNND